MAKPVFFFGFQRSGTTLLSMMLDSHPDLAVPFSVTGLWYRYAERIEVYNSLRLHEDLRRLVDDLLEEERLKLWQIPLNRENVLSNLSLGSYAAVIERFHMLYADHHGKSYWGHLDISTLAKMDVAMTWFPDAKFVHLVRDGRDVALSNQGIPYSVGNIAECAAAWHQQVSANLNMGQQLGPERYRVVSYEELIRTPETTLGGLCNFIGLTFSPAMLTYSNKVQQRIPADRRFLWPRLDSPPDHTRVHRWQAEMSLAQRTLFEGIAGPTLQTLGYATQSVPTARWRAKLLGAWYRLTRGHRWRRLARSLGLTETRIG